MWKDFTDEPEVVAKIRQCPEMVAKDDHFGLVLECGARVLWVAGSVTQKDLTNHRRPFMLPREVRGEQLDLFKDLPEDTPLTKLTE